MIQHIFKILNFAKQRLHYLMIISMLTGLSNVYFFGGFNVPRQILIIIVTVFVIYPVMINTKFEELFSHFKEPRPIFCNLILNFAFSPLIALLLGRLFFTNQSELFATLVLISLIPTSAMSVTWTSFSDAKIATALFLVPLNILFAVFIGLPFIFPFLIGDIINVNTFSIIKNVLLVFLVPLIVGDMTRRMLVKYRGNAFFQKSIKPNLGGVSSFGILLLIFLVMSLERNSLLLQNYMLILTIVVPVALYYLSLYTISTMWTKILIRQKILPGEKAVVLIYTSVARHINISMAVVLSTFSLDKASIMMLLLIIAYMIQVPSLAFFAQTFGKKLARE